MTRPVLRTLGSYADCFQLLEKAASRGGLVVDFPSSSAATQFRHRCYAARKLLAQKQGETPYDSMEIVKTAEEPLRLTFRIRSIERMNIVISDLDGTPITADEEDDFAKQAKRLRGELDLDIG